MSDLSEAIQKAKNKRNDELARYATKADIRSCRWAGNRWALGGRLIGCGFKPLPATAIQATYEAMDGTIKPLNIILDRVRISS